MMTLFVGSRKDCCIKLSAGQIPYLATYKVEGPQESPESLAPGTFGTHRPMVTGARGRKVAAPDLPGGRAGIFPCQGP